MSQSTKSSREPRTAFVGRYVLDSLSFGMYDHPLMALREYVQNSADAIDDSGGCAGGGSDGNALIDITVDGRSRSVKIEDNGTGIMAQKAWNVLHDLGRSEKDPRRSRGFRGIGRLGGLGYCRRLSFSTKAAGEELASFCTWDCDRLRQLMSDTHSSLDVTSLMQQVTTFEQAEYGGARDDHFFAVEMTGVRSSRDLLLDVPAIRNYLAQVAPVPFDATVFRFGPQIDEELRKSVPTYGTYQIRVNGQEIHKPYGNSVRAGDSWEEIAGIEFFELVGNDGRLALGWMGNLRLGGRVDPSSLVDGLRVRSGNIQIGQKDLLAEFYREKRFGSYMIGEIHTIDSRLVPNSRRDDFEDVPLRDDFHVSLIREIGIPFSRQIRELSSQRSKAKRLGDVHTLCSRARKIVERGYFAESQRQEIGEKLLEARSDGCDDNVKDELEGLLKQLTVSKHFLDNGYGRSHDHASEVLRNVLESIYTGISDKTEAEALVERVLEGLATIQTSSGAVATS